LRFSFLQRVREVSEDTGRGGRDFLDSSAEGMVFEGNRSEALFLP
jgi:hypothetical protein